MPLAGEVVRERDYLCVASWSPRAAIWQMATASTSAASQMVEIRRMTDTLSIYTLYGALSAPAAPGANPHG
jgi:hypothetical protein